MASKQSKILRTINFFDLALIFCCTTKVHAVPNTSNQVSIKFTLCWKLSLDIRIESRIMPTVKKGHCILHFLSIWAVLGKLHHHLPPVYQPPWKVTKKIEHERDSKTCMIEIWKYEWRRGTNRPVDQLPSAPRPHTCTSRRQTLASRQSYRIDV